MGNAKNKAGERASPARANVPAPSDATVSAPKNIGEKPIQTILQSREKIWKVVALIVSLAAICVPLCNAWTIRSFGATPEKHLELIADGPINPTYDLSSIKDQATLSLKVDGQIFDNILIAHAYFLNPGNAPILPSDFVEPLSVSVPPSWKIVAVRNYIDHAVKLQWKRTSDSKFEAGPTLLNPGDRFSAILYITSTDKSNEGTDPEISWNARIVNLRAISRPPTIFQRAQARGGGPSIELAGYSLVFMIVAAIILQAVFFHALSRWGVFRNWTWKSVAWVIFGSYLAYATGDALATYIFGTVVSDILGVDPWLNLPPIITQVGLIAFLYLKKPKMKASSV